LDLPPEWVREEDPSGAVYYLNAKENISTKRHPLISKFRSLFMEILEYRLALLKLIV
jgi:WW domain.